MISYCSMGVKRKLLSTLSSFNHYEQDQSELQLILQEIFLQLSSLGGSNPESYSSIVANILVCEGTKCMKNNNDADITDIDSSSKDEFMCGNCKELLMQPITLACGHTFCSSCLHGQWMQNCLSCEAVIPKEKLLLYKINVGLWKVLKKLYPDEITGHELLESGIQYLEQGQTTNAINALTNALAYMPFSHTVFLHRAQAYLQQADYSSALSDAHRAVKLSSKWSKAHFVKGEILLKQQFYEKALLCYLTAYVLEPREVLAKQRMATIISKLLQVSKRLSGHSEGKRYCTKRRLSHDFDNAFPAKRPFSLGLQSDLPTEEGLSGHLGRDYCSAHDLRRSGSTSSNTPNLNLSCSDSSLDRLCITPEIEQCLGRLLFDHFSSHCDTTDKNEMQPRLVDSSRIDASDFDCSLCYRLLHDPVCTPCGHTFCQFCIERSLDHGVNCPLCKQSIEESLTEQLKNLHTKSDHLTNFIIQKYLSNEYEERKKQHDEEINEINEKQPIFVCTIAFPSVPCPLHIFEPRYRLMLRRCLEFNGREFGMCMPDAPNPHCQTGTLLKVRNVTYFSDGRSVVDSIGVRRFKTTKCQMKDGYNVAKHNYIVDKPVRNPSATKELSSNVYNAANAWFTSLYPNIRETISQHFGNFPTREDNFDSDNGPDWHWWVLAVMPAENRVKAAILGKSSYHERLLIMHRIFLCLQKRQNAAKSSNNASS